MMRSGILVAVILLMAGLLAVSVPVQAQQQAHVLPDRTPDATERSQAQEPAAAAADELPTWQRTLYKTLTYQAAANAADVLVFDLLVGATAATTTGFFAANATSAAVAYYGFEYAWQSFDPPLDETTERTLVEKLVLFRFIGVGRNFALGYVFGGGPLAGTAYAGANILYDTAIFATNEYVWDIMRPQQAP